jgi:hypothetical protein
MTVLGVVLVLAIAVFLPVIAIEIARNIKTILRLRRLQKEAEEWGKSKPQPWKKP